MPYFGDQMTPKYLNSSQTSSFFTGSSNIENHDQQFHHQFFGPSFHPQHDASSSHSFHFYVNLTQEQAGYNNYHTELANHHHQQQFDQGNESVVAYGGSYDPYQIEKKVGKGLKICLGSSDERKQKVVGDHQEANNNDEKSNSAKWMSSKMRMMQKMKKSDNKLPYKNNNNSSVSSSDSKDHGSNCSSYNNNNNPIRVCTDCNTTKTPLWRSGPKGPKSLCNACGIRQRKARRALAAAAAATADETTPSPPLPLPPPPPPPPPTTKTVKIKVNHPKADKSSKNNYGINGLSTVPFKKRCRITNTTTTNNASLATESTSDQESAQAKKLGFEDFLINLSNKLAFHHVFPQDEKEAAILLMALSCGLVHG